MHRPVLRNLIITCLVLIATLVFSPFALGAQINLAWDPNTESNLAGYKVYYGTASGTYGTPINVGNVTTYSLTGLAQGRTYFIAVTAYNTSNQESGFSNEVIGASKNAETVGTPGMLSGPTSGTTGTSYTYTTGGSSSNLGDPVEYQFDWTGNASDLSPWGSATQSKTWAIAGTYNVRSRARCTIHPSVVSNWSGSLSVVVSSSLAAAALVSPNGTITTVMPSYIWNAVSRSTWYQLSVNDTTGNKILQWYTASAVGCSSGKGKCTVTPSRVLAAGAAQWKVQTWVNGAAGPWSNPTAFTVNVPQPPTPPIAPALVSPSGMIATTTPTYSWNAVSNATDYYLWVNDSSGNRIQQWYTAAASGCGSGAGTCSVTPATALNAGAGQWWVQTKNTAGTGPWSAPMSFTVSGGTSGAPPGAATLRSPSGSIATRTPTYTWKAVSNSTWYYLSVSDSKGNRIATWYTAAAVGCSKTGETCSVTPATTLNPGAGQWSIQTYNSYGTGPWSAPKNFTVR